MRDTKLLIIALMLGLNAFQSFMCHHAIKKSRTQTDEAIAIGQALVEQIKSISKPNEHGITYYLSSEGSWHSNHVVGKFYLNDKTHTWEEFNP